ncbi:MAG: multidrug efflux SMR transporter [Burkholderiales bacterium]
MSWFILFAAGLFEIGWAVGLRFTEGFTRPVPTVLTVVSMIVSVVLLSLAMRTLPLGVSYVVWTGIGAVGTVVVGAFLGEPLKLAQWACVALIVSGVVGLKALSPA